MVETINTNQNTRDLNCSSTMQPIFYDNEDNEELSRRKKKKRNNNKGLAL